MKHRTHLKTGVPRLVPLLGASGTRRHKGLSGKWRVARARLFTDGVVTGGALQSVPQTCMPTCQQPYAPTLGGWSRPKKYATKPGGKEEKVCSWSIVVIPQADFLLFVIAVKVAALWWTSPPNNYSVSTAKTLQSCSVYAGNASHTGLLFRSQKENAESKQRLCNTLIAGSF